MQATHNLDHTSQISSPDVTQEYASTTHADDDHSMITQGQKHVHTHSPPPSEKPDRRHHDEFGNVRVTPLSPASKAARKLAKRLRQNKSPLSQYDLQIQALQSSSSAAIETSFPDFTAVVDPTLPSELARSSSSEIVPPNHLDAITSTSASRPSITASLVATTNLASTNTVQTTTTPPPLDNHQCNVSIRVLSTVSESNVLPPTTDIDEIRDSYDEGSDEGSDIILDDPSEHEDNMGNLYSDNVGSARVVKPTYDAPDLSSDDPLDPSRSSLNPEIASPMNVVAHTYQEISELSIIPGTTFHHLIDPKIVQERMEAYITERGSTLQTWSNKAYTVTEFMNIFENEEYISAGYPRRLQHYAGYGSWQDLQDLQDRSKTVYNTPATHRNNRCFQVAKNAELNRLVSSSHGKDYRDDKQNHVHGRRTSSICAKKDDYLHVLLTEIEWQYYHLFQMEFSHLCLNGLKSCQNIFRHIRLEGANLNNSRTHCQSTEDYDYDFTTKFRRVSEGLSAPDPRACPNEIWQCDELRHQSSPCLKIISSTEPLSNSLSQLERMTPSQLLNEVKLRKRAMEIAGNDSRPASLSSAVTTVLAVESSGSALATAVTAGSSSHAKPVQRISDVTTICLRCTGNQLSRKLCIGTEGIACQRCVSRGWWCSYIKDVEQQDHMPTLGYSKKFTACFNCRYSKIKDHSSKCDIIQGENGETLSVCGRCLRDKVPGCSVLSSD